jgi:TonB-linked SusC/RagA family outer membrane protein
VLNEIEMQSEFYFMYNADFVNVNQRVTVKLQNKTIYEILDKVLTRTGIQYEIIEKQIVLTPLTETGSLDLDDPKVVVTGYVYDDAGEPIPGVTVIVKGTTIGSFTNNMGYFSIDVPEGSNVLVFSYIGYKTTEVEINNRTEITVNLEPDLTDIEEVIVVGYGTTSKKFLTNSVSNITSDEITEAASSGFKSALQGKMTGVQVIQNSGTPGSGVSVNIRGTKSILGGTQPLYVVDGVPITTGDYSQIGDFDQTLDAGLDINPNDIESISVLKDASATIYGTRAANGVVIITTKRGAAGKTNISYNGYYGLQKEWKRLDMLNAQEWRNYVRSFDPDFVDALQDTTIDTDWQDEVFRLAPIMSHELSISGGNEKTHIFASGGFFDQKGIVLGSRFRKYSGRINLNHKITDKLSVSLKSGNTYSINDRIVGDQEIHTVLPNAISKPPIYAVKDSLGNYLEEGFWANPVAIANEVTNEALSLRNISNLDISYKIIQGLTFKNQTGFDFLNLIERRYEPTTVRRGAASNGIAVDARASVLRFMQTSTLDYNFNIGGDHNFDILLGYSLEKSTRRYSEISGSNFASDEFEYLNTAGVVDAYSSSKYISSLNSFFGRLKYNLLNKYIAEVTFRSDGSYKFAPENRYVPLPGVSLAWRIAEENFLSGLKSLNELKLKLSYGKTGNDQIRDHQWRNLYDGGYNYLGQPGIVPSHIPNPDLVWETSNNYNVGLDIELFKSRVAISIEGYYIKTVDLLLDRPVPMTTGFSVVYENFGSLLNKGLEFSVNTVNVDGDFQWLTDLNMSFNENEIIELDNDNSMTGVGRGNNAVLEGYPIGVFYQYKCLGVDPSTGEFVFEDLDGDGQLSSGDRQVVGDPNPIFTGGFTNIFSYKGIELRAFLQFSYGNDIFNGTRRYASAMKYGTDENLMSYVQDRWMQPGDETYVPKYNGQYNIEPSSYYIEDGSYLRFKEVTLSYSFPKKILGKHINKLKIYAKGQNVLTFTNYTGLDPEVNYRPRGTIRRGTDFFTFPHARTFMFGINIKF